MTQRWEVGTGRCLGFVSQAVLPNWLDGGL